MAEAAAKHNRDRPLERDVPLCTSAKPPRQQDDAKSSIFLSKRYPYHGNKPEPSYDGARNGVQLTGSSECEEARRRSR